MWDTDDIKFKKMFNEAFEQKNKKELKRVIDALAKM